MWGDLYISSPNFSNCGMGHIIIIKLELKAVTVIDGIGTFQYIYTLISLVLVIQIE